MASPKRAKPGKTAGFPGFKERVFDEEQFLIMSDAEFYRTYKLFTAQVVKDFYQYVMAIRTPQSFKLEDYESGRKVIIDRLNESSMNCNELIYILKNVMLMNKLIYTRFFKEMENAGTESRNKKRSEGSKSSPGK